PLQVGFDAVHVAERLAVPPARDLRCDRADALPEARIETALLGDGLCLQQRPPPGVVAAHHEADPFSVERLRPETPELAVVADSARDVPDGIVDRAEIRVLRLDLAEGRWHQLHEAAGADAAGRGGVELALRHRLRLEEAPVES